MCPGFDSASKNEYQDTPGGKDLHSVESQEIRSLNLPDPLGPPRSVAGHLYLLPFTHMQYSKIKKKYWKLKILPYILEQAMCGMLFTIFDIQQIEEHQVSWFLCPSFVFVNVIPQHWYTLKTGCFYSQC